MSDWMVEEGRVGPRLVLTSAWTPAAGEYMRSQGIKGLLCNYAKGWTGSDLQFLEEIPNTEEFEIIDWTIADISPIHSLAGLISLKVSTYCGTAVDFSSFPALQYCMLHWRNGSESLFDVAGLQYLGLYEYSGSDSDVFSRLVNLTDLDLAGAALTEVESLGDLNHLRGLRLGPLPNLTSLAGLERLERLEDLEITDCDGVHTIAVAGQLPQLRKLIVGDCGQIESRSPLEGAEMLEWLVFDGTTNIEDGNLAVLEGLPRLRMVAFKNRSHYTHTRSQVAAMIGGRKPS